MTPKQMEELESAIGEVLFLANTTDDKVSVMLSDLAHDMTKVAARIKTEGLVVE
jgi:hypothetical protein